MLHWALKNPDSKLPFSSRRLAQAWQDHRHPTWPIPFLLAVSKVGWERFDRPVSVLPLPSWVCQTGPALRSNPSSEVTDHFCQLPLLTLFYRLEAAHLGDLLHWKYSFKEADDIFSTVLESGSSSKNDSKCKVSCQASADHLAYHCTIIILN